jgi:uncharacterized protein (DUF849 family)
MTSEAPVIIEVAVNGVTTKARNPEVPDTPQAVAEDAVHCLDEGAAIIHSHTTQMGMPSAAAAEEYATIFRLIRAERDDGILYPTMGGGSNISERFDHHLPLAGEELISMAVIDPGSINMASSSPDGAPPEGDRVYVNSPADIRYMMDVCQRERLGPSFGVYEPGFMRMVLVYHEAGQLAPGSLSKFYFSGGGYFEAGTPTWSAPPIPEALDLYLAMKADAPLTWGVAVLGGSLLESPVARMAVERGGHLRVGLEDWGRGPSNVEQVRMAVALCHDVGRDVATTKEAREILGLQR